MNNRLTVTPYDLLKFRTIRGGSGTIDVTEENVLTTSSISGWPDRAFKVYAIENPIAGETYTLKCKARALSGRGSLVIDYPTATLAKASIKIEAAYWREYSISYTIPFLTEVIEPTLEFVIGCIGSDIGQVEFTDVRGEVVNSRNPPIGDAANILDSVNILEEYGSPTGEYDWDGTDNSDYSFKFIRSRYTEPSAALPSNPFPFGSAGLTLPYRSSSNPYAAQIVFNTSSIGAKIRTGDSSGWSNWATLLHSSNTTIDANGFIKKASPILNLYDDRIEVNNRDGFTVTPKFNKVETGVYQIHNTLGLRVDNGWYIETPNDRNGNKYFNVEWDQNIQIDNLDGVVDEYRDDIVVTIRTYKKVWNRETGIFENGDPVDINYEQDRFIALRFNELKRVSIEDDSN